MKREPGLRPPEMRAAPDCGQMPVGANLFLRAPATEALGGRMFEFLLSSHMPEKTLIHYQAGLLDKERSEMLEAHLLLCPTCQLQLVSRLTAASRLPQFCETH
jgi:hypothetical protein